MKTEKKAGTVGFVILMVIIGLVYFALLELSKNTIVGWIAAAILFFFYIFTRQNRYRAKGFLKRLGVFALFAVMLAVIFAFTQPPFRQVPAVENKNPEKTEVVTVKQGQLTGVYNKDRTVEVYAGIPYAKPPVGDLRWKEPQQPDKWEGVKECDTFAPRSMQALSLPIVDTLTDLIGYQRFSISLKDNYREAVSEDSLYLNVWKGADTPEDAPVLVFIHGGSLTGGSPSYSEYNGESLAKKGIIVVNFAYRLNVFGYYANEELAKESKNGTTGNYGLLDQVQALKWVHENIAAFGGDPEKVTVAGESAGSSSVNALCVSPLAKGLFRYAIGESSSVTAIRPYHTFRSMKSALKMGKDIMEEFGCSSVEDLRKIDAKKLVATSFTNSAMTVDGYAVTEQPYKTYEKKKNNEKALLNGFNAHEADPFTLFMKADADNYISLLENILGSYAQQAADLYPYRETVPDYKMPVDAGGEAKGTVNELYSAAWFTYSHKTWSELVAAEGRPVYLYWFTKNNGGLRAYHGGEMPYCYGNLGAHAYQYDEQDAFLSEKMQDYWVNFVKTGDPNGVGLVVWDKYNDRPDDVLRFDSEIYMTANPHTEVYKLLDKYQEGLK